MTESLIKYADIQGSIFEYCAGEDKAIAKYFDNRRIVITEETLAMATIRIHDIYKDIHFLTTTKLKQWQKPQPGNTANFRILGNRSADNSTPEPPARVYRCYTFLHGEWCYQGVFAGIDRFRRIDRIDC